MVRRSLIFGISGQDGAYLAKYLLEKGYEVYGTSRNADANQFLNLKALGILDRFTPLSVDVTDHVSVFKCISEVQPDEIYNLSGQSSVGLSFENPVETYESIITVTLNILESVRLQEKEIRVFNACSSECFGDTGSSLAYESTPFQPKSPYAIAKAAAFWMTKSYREAHQIPACSGILFNHESPLRPDRFVTQKIIRASVEISQGNNQNLTLGNIDVVRDWGWAPEYVEAMHLMMKQEEADDFVVATGDSHSLKDFLSCAFSYFDLDWEKHVIIDKSLYRSSDICVSRGNPNKVQSILGWVSNFTLKDIVNAMIEDRINRAE
jgi:GDPmannose 4,6-dehydratase|tara:strand:+ start:648 stop:1613 length:966 start_codon:yes stop_codon:yes gene_type:complete